MVVVGDSIICKRGIKYHLQVVLMIDQRECISQYLEQVRPTVVETIMASFTLINLLPKKLFLMVLAHTFVNAMLCSTTFHLNLPFLCSKTGMMAYTLCTPSLSLCVTLLLYAIIPYTVLISLIFSTCHPYIYHHFYKNLVHNNTLRVGKIQH